MRIKKIMVALLTITIFLTSMIGSGITAFAASEPTIEISDDIVSFIIKPGDTTHIRIPINAIGEGIVLPEATIVDKNENSPFTFTKPILTTDYKVVASFVPINQITYVDFDVTAKETAVIDNYSISLKVAGTYTLDQLPCGPTLDFNLKILEEKAPAQLTISEVSYNNSVIGSATDLSFIVKNEGEITAFNSYISLNYGDTGIEKGYTKESIKIGDLAPGAFQLISLPISILPTATLGKKTIVANFTYKTIDGGTGLTESDNISINVKSNNNAPILNVEGITYDKSLAQGDDFTLVTAIINSGASKAENIKVSIDDSSIGKDIFKNYFTDEIAVMDIKQDSKKTVEIPLTVAKIASGGPKELKINITYTDNTGVPYSLIKTVYVDVTGEGTTINSNIIISNVKQTPAQPIAGENIEVSFDITNKSAVDITELKISTEGLTSATFIPVNSEPYQYIEKLKAGEIKRITIPLIASDSIPAGLNNLSVKFIYPENKEGFSLETIPVRNVVNDMGSSVIPKIIVSKYVTDIEELKAGSTFNFSFDLRNTNASVAAKNITVTVSKAASLQSEVYSVTQGSNSFFIDKIKPDEKVQNTLEFKIKSDTATGTYPISITVEYEYDGAKPNDKGEIGVTKTYDLNLQVVENARPVVDNVNVYSFDGNVIVGNPATLAFEFYNMGKSQLNNVVATVEGDLTKSDGTMYFIGNVTPGLSTYTEFEVIPNIEGTAKGVLKITYEDSNGDQVEFTKDFETMVQGVVIMDPGMGEGGNGEVFNPGGVVAKKAIMPIWLFIIIQIILFLLFISITRKAIISVYKSKLRKKEEEKY